MLKKTSEPAPLAAYTAPSGRRVKQQLSAGLIIDVIDVTDDTEAAAKSVVRFMQTVLRNRAQHSFNEFAYLFLPEARNDTMITKKIYIFFNTHTFAYAMLFVMPFYIENETLCLRHESDLFSC